MAKTRRTALETSTVANAISDAYSLLTELRDEVREVVDNAPESLQETPRNQALAETADTLDQYCEDEPELKNEEAQNLEVSYYPLPKRASRAKRRDYATGILSACISALQEFKETVENRREALEKSDTDERGGRAHELSTLEDELDEVLDVLENFMGDADGCEFPGMFG